MSWGNLKPPAPASDGWGTPPKQDNWAAMDASRFAGLTGQAGVDAGKWNIPVVTCPELIHDEIDMTSSDRANTYLAMEDGEINGNLPWEGSLTPSEQKMIDDAWETHKNAWPTHSDQTSPMTVGPEQFFEEELSDALWTANALDSAVTKAGVVNSLAGTKDEFNVDPDGELTRMKEIVASTQPGPHGFYIAYHNGRWLHAILSGPYDTQADAYLRADAAYDKMINDTAFKLAFENKFERAGIYCAQIPLSTRRKGAYGVING